MNILLKLYRFLFASSKFYKLNLLLFHMSLRGIGVLNYESSKVSGEDYLINELLPRLVKSGTPTFFDVGANTGDYTRLLSNRFPNAFIHSFEPHPKNFLYLNALNLPNITTYNIAIGENREKRMLYDRIDIDGSPHASVYEDVISDIHHQESRATHIQVETVEDITRNKAIGYIDFLKIDTEGHELAVLKGAYNLLENQAIGCIHIEFNEMNIVSKVFFRDFRKLLPNYVFYRLLPHSLILLDDTPVMTEIFAYQNILAVQKNQISLLESL
jgi:FkbM family methyltransferase